MALHDTCIRRPVFATMLTLALVVLGIFAYRELGVDLFPKIDMPTIVVSTALPGAGPEEIEAQVTKPIEEAVNTVSGIDELRSTSFEGLSQVVIVFTLEKSGDAASQEIRDKVSRILADLPEGTQQPVIEKFDPDAQPIMTISVFGDMPIREVTELARKRIKEVLDTVNGVGQVKLVGGREREIHVVLDADRMTSYGVTVQDITKTLRLENIEIPGGRVDQGDRELVLRILGRMMTTQEFSELVVAEKNEGLIRIRDIAKVEDTEEEARTFASFDGKTAVSLVVRKQSGENTVEIAKRINEKLSEIKKTLPPGLNAEVIRDQSQFIEESIHEVDTHLILGGLLAALTVLLFLRSWRPTIIAGVAIPVSLVATFTILRLMNFTLNNLTLMGLTVAVGLVIDDALVILENIFRHIEEKGSEPIKASHEATSEIGLAVTTTTLSLSVIFLSIAYMKGIMGRFLTSYGLTVAAAVMISLFVSFTLTPMLCSRFLKKPKEGKGSHDSKFDAFIQNGYLRVLKWAMAHRKIVIAISVLVAFSVLPIFAFKLVGVEFLPQDDQSEFEVTITAPEGFTVTRSYRLLQELESKMKSLPEISHILSSIGEGEGAAPNALRIYLKLTSLKERKISQFEIMKMARKIMENYPELRTSVQEVKPMSGGGFKSQLFNLTIRGPELERLKEYVEKILEIMHKHSELVDIDSTLNFGKPELRVKIDRDRAADLGVSARDIADALRLLVGGDLKITSFREGDEVYDVKVRARQEERDRLAAIGNLRIPGRNGTMIPLVSIARIDETTGPTQIDRYNRQKQVTLLANLQPGATLGDVVSKVRTDVETLKLPSDYQFEFVGMAKIMREMVENFLLAFLLAFIFMYIILAAQFESFVHPITILLTLPLSIPFALITLAFFGMSVNIFSLLGLFMLFGVVKKNAILQVDYTNTLRAQGMNRYDAIIEANRARFRPILMTTVTLVMGMIPLALGRGAGAGSRATMGVAIIGGQSLCLFLTLLLAPVLYSYFDDLEVWFKKKTRA